jgi:Ecdysteroid kinase-like family
MDAESIWEMHTLQELWSGFGSIVRYGLIGADVETVIVKHIKLPKRLKGTKGRETPRSITRKVRSYGIESYWYKNWSMKGSKGCPMPKCYGIVNEQNSIVLILEDLAASGYSLKKQKLCLDGMKPCIEWLAHFHATYMGKSTDGLWKVGTYWHLKTRPDEWHNLKDLRLKNAAVGIDQVLSQAQFKTLVHGDAKLENFCFSKDGKRVAAVDYQYVGGGCGMKDLAYFVGSCLEDSDCERYSSAILEHYFHTLSQALTQQHQMNDKIISQIETEWRAMYPYAWVDLIDSCKVGVCK